MQKYDEYTKILHDMFAKDPYPKQASHVLRSCEFKIDSHYKPSSIPFILDGLPPQAKKK